MRFQQSSAWVFTLRAAAIEWAVNVEGALQTTQVVTVQGVELLSSVIRHNSPSLSPREAEQNGVRLPRSLLLGVPSGKWRDFLPLF